MFIRSLLTLILIFSLTSIASAEDVSSDAEAKAIMHQVYDSYSKLQPYLADADTFNSPEKNNEILNLLKTLSKSFHTVEKFSGAMKKDPTLSVTLSVTKDLLEDATNRFSEGKKSYARWRLQSAGQYCVTCHTRHEIPADFSPPTEEIESLPPFARAQYYLASRQFENAKTIFRGIARTTRNLQERMGALRKILLILVRVSPNPQSALEELKAVKDSVTLSAYEQSEIASWEKGLKNWAEEKKAPAETAAAAEKLILSAIAKTSVSDDAAGTIDLLRATKLLHGILEKSTSNDRKHALYLLGMAYKHLDLFTIPELAPLFLEQCIREFPGSDDAKRSYKIYDSIRTVEFSGIEGGALPSDVQAELNELRAIAFGESSNIDLFKM